MPSSSVAPLLLAVVLVLLIAESIVVRHRVARIPLRIHVNGTRGKSSVACYVAAGLRAGQRSVFAKVTGIQPTLVLPDGSRRALRRRGPARVQEQFRTIGLAARATADALVLECMSLVPELQRLESRVFSPHIYVITNVRDDHLEQMGLGEEERLAAICSGIPRGCVVVTDDAEHEAAILQAARQRGATVVSSRGCDDPRLGEPPAGVFAPNLRMAVAVCRLAGVDEEAALGGILDEAEARSESPLTLRLGGRRITFVNGFGVNDVSSASAYLDHWQGRLGRSDPLIVVLNTRVDRPLRSVQFARWCGALPGLSRLVVTGGHRAFARRMLVSSGFPRERLTVWAPREARDAAARLAGLVSSDTMVFGLGNIAADGFSVVASLEAAAKEAAS